MLIAQEIEYSECLTNSDNEVVHEFEPTKIVAAAHLNVFSRLRETQNNAL